jgi:putative intracellular protease/amidase
MAQSQAGFTVLPNYSFQDSPAMDAFLIPGGYGTRQEMHNRRLHAFIRSLPEATLLTSVCTGSWVYGHPPRVTPNQPCEAHRSQTCHHSDPRGLRAWQLAATISL